MGIETNGPTVPIVDRELSGRDAYNQVLEDMTALDRFPNSRRSVPGGQYFKYGEDGYGITLPGNLAFVSSETALDIRAIEGEYNIKNGWLEYSDSYGNSPDYRALDLSGIPDELIPKVTQFAKEVRRFAESFGHKQAP